MDKGLEPRVFVGMHIFGTCGVRVRPVATQTGGSAGLGPCPPVLNPSLLQSPHWAQLLLNDRLAGHAW